MRVYRYIFELGLGDKQNTKQKLSHSVQVETRLGSQSACVRLTWSTYQLDQGIVAMLG